MTLTFNANIAALEHRQGRLQRTRDIGSADAIEAWIYTPRKIDPKAAPLVAVHGISRRAKQQAELFADAADRVGRIVIAPHFPKSTWAKYQRITKRHRADLPFLGLLDHVRLTGVADTRRFELFGYSGGAQFAHRFAMLYPQRLTKLHVAAAGWYCMPNTSARFPYGLAIRDGQRRDFGQPIPRALNRFLSLPIQVLCGEQDTTRDRELRQLPSVDRQQGQTRLARAQRYAGALIDAACSQGIAPDVSFQKIPDCAHSFAHCVYRGGLDRLVLG